MLIAHRIRPRTAVRLPPASFDLPNMSRSHCIRHLLWPIASRSYLPAGSPRHRSNSLRRKAESEATIKDLIMKVLQQQHAISKTQTEILQTQHSNYHALLEITENMQHTISRIETVQEDVQVSDKIAFAAGFGCGLLVLLGIWLSPFGGKEKDDDAEK